MRFAVTDIETTGRSNKITEIAILVYDSEKNEVVDQFVSLVNPETKINSYVSVLTGITDEMVEDAPKFYEIAKDVFEITEGCVFVAHSVGFDYNIIRREFHDLGGQFNRQKLCTVRLSRKILPGHKSYSLGKLCNDLGFGIEGRHRAWGDAEATVKLLSILLDRDENDHVGYSLNRRNREATIPPHLDKKIFDDLPSKPGVYYFHDEKGKILYVGKAKDIKSRINGHFLDNTTKKVRLKDHVHDITYQETGSELLALLIESAEIRNHFPEFNKAQKYTTGGYIICKYEGNDGIIRFKAAKNQKFGPKPLALFSNMIKARAFLEQLCEEYELCPRFCGLQNTNGACFHHSINKCHGICSDEEEVEAYNDRVEQSLRSFTLESGTFAIMQPGRTRSERAVILVRNGEYQGYAYLDEESQVEDIRDLDDIIVPQKHTSDIQRILVSAFKKMPSDKVLRFQSVSY